jgi:hypothetical protein
MKSVQLSAWRDRLGGHMLVQSRLKWALRLFAIVVASSALLSACTIRLISSYDEQTDKSVTELQRKFETLFVKLEGLKTPPECTYPKNKEFYDQAKVDISAIKVRVDAIPQNEISQEQARLLQESIESLEKLHQAKGNDRCFEPDEFKALRNAFKSSFTAILKLELAKKRGESK